MTIRHAKYVTIRNVGSTCRKCNNVESHVGNAIMIQIGSVVGHWIQINININFFIVLYLNCALFFIKYKIVHLLPKLGFPNLQGLST